MLSLYSSARTAGIVCYAVPIDASYSVPHTVMWLNIAGRRLAASLHKILNERGHTLTTSAEREIVHGVKEKFVYVGLDSEARFQKNTTTTDCHVSSALLDGNGIVSADEHF
jgi:actin-related protein